ncbi:hypothetical protein EYF80_025834 [Liparis tanakae]|uniref:Uncharacterized protein n=1 Tax=Liparis tanakae TaxID=230148 RepID=A0A4Z2HGM7_9TELE|nr:hypothetical protein EYF80_025834 [Liparis tanakae]
MGRTCCNAAEQIASVSPRMDAIHFCFLRTATPVTASQIRAITQLQRGVPQEDDGEQQRQDV